MNLLLLTLGVVCGWCVLLALPWALTGNPNPLDSTAGYAMLLPLLLPLWFLSEAGASRCPKFTQSRLAWLSKNASSARWNLVLMGIGSGLLFAAPSAVMFTLALAYLPGGPAVSGLLLLGVVAVVHAMLFGVSFFAAIEFAKSWARKVNAVKRKKAAVEYKQIR